MGIYPVSLFIDRSSHRNFSNNPTLVGIVPVIWFREISSLSSLARFETELGIWPEILLLARFTTFKFSILLRSGMLLDIWLLEPSITSMSLLVMLLNIFEREPCSRFEWRSRTEIWSGRLIDERLDVSRLLEIFSLQVGHVCQETRNPGCEVVVR